MGDMKTPDFDDLLAAFDIPDIDAKEAIQSSPDEGAEGVGKARVNVTEGSSTTSPSSPSLSGDIPVVSVIVKNRVQSDTYEEAERSNDENEGDSSEDSDSDTENQSRVGDALLGSQLDPSISGLGPSDAQPHNGLETSAAHQRSSLRGQGTANGELWSQTSPLSSPVSVSEGEIEERAMGGSVSTAGHTANILSRLKPPLTPHSLPSSALSMTFPSTSSSSPPTLSFNQRLPLHSNQNEDAPQLSGRLPSLSSNGSSNAGIRHIIDSYEEDSEPDLGSPLVIQESPGSPVSPTPRVQRRNRVSSKKFSFPPQSPPHPLPCPPPLSSSLTLSTPKPRPQEEMPSTTRSPAQPVQPRGSQDWLSSTLSGPTPVQEEKYPEHIIDERDSPESPPPDQTGLSVPKESPSPAAAPAPASSLQPPQDGEEPMESEPSQESRAREVKEVKVEKMDFDDGGQAKKENTSSGSSSVVGTAKASAAVLSPSSRPLKVKIKTVKTPTGSITRTVTRVAPKAGGPADGSKPAAGEHKVMNRPKRMAVKPALTYQEASAAMLVAASKAQGKGTAEGKPKVSATAVSITKAAALPTISSSPRMSPGGVSVRSLGQKTLTSGMPVSSPSPLLPPQGSSRPASIVNSTGAIISRSQSSLVEAFNKILNSKNLLPCYKPDLSAPLPSEWGLPLPAQGYRCLECGDAFALERSLARHYDRRSLRIEVTCNHCAKRLAFFNKCSLLLHAREHKEKGLVMQCSHLVMKPVTVEQMTGHQDTMPMGTLSSSPSTSSVLSSAVSSALSLAAAPQLQHAAASKRAEAVQYPNNKCPECQTPFGSKDEVVAHFQEIKAGANASCAECSPSMLLPNACSAAAHQRVHKACGPHVCPECGGVAKQSAFQSHLEETCLHFARRIGYRCSSCHVVFGGLNSVKSHIQTAHCEVFHKCPSCPMAFKSAPGAQNHISSHHPTLPAGQAKMIFKCVMCDTVFTQKALLYVHFDTHLAKQKVHVFKCPECTKLYAQRSSMLDHVRSVHKDVAVKQESSVAMTPSPALPPRARRAVKTESSDGEEWRDREEEEDEEAEREKAKTVVGWNCAPCHARYSDREDYISHMAEQHGKILKKFPCSQCESSFSSTSSLRRHVRVKHKDVKRVFNCKFCNNGKKTFSSRLVLERHIQLRHGMDALSQETQQKPGVGMDGADSSSEQDGGPGPRLTEEGEGRRGVLRKKEEGPEGGGTAKKARATSDAAPESGFRCALCGFTTEEQAAFLEHIPQHRTEGAGGLSLQCVQCGACFTSATSLSRHRFITHRIRDAPHDSRRGKRDRAAPSAGNGGGHVDPGAWGESPAGSPSPHPSAPLGEEGEGKQPCKVCGKRFEKASDLSTHLRTHGMAFLTARKTDKPT
ncbi:zinc finger protein 687a [Aplochiton taeniatus]